MPFARVFFHFVWTTKNRHPLIAGDNRKTVERSIRATCTAQRVLIHALESVPDHVHMVVSLPPSLSMSRFMQLVKGSSSHLINHAGPITTTPRDLFEWQAEYGVLTFSDDALEDVVEYVDNQEIHHATGNLRPLFEQTERNRA